MVTKEHIGYQVRYFDEGWRFGTLINVDKATASIKHPVLKKIQKVRVIDCEIYGERKVMATVYESLFQAAQTVKFEKQRIDQTDDEYLTSLIRAVSTVDDATWAKLPIEAQQWYDKGATNINTTLPPRQDNPLLGFVGKGEFKETKEVVTPPKGMSATELLSTSRASRFQAATPNPTFPKEKGKKGRGYMDAVRKTVITHPDWTSRQVYDYLKLNGHPEAKLDTISVDGGNVRRVIELAKEMGLWIKTDEAPTTETKTEVAS